MTSAMKNFVNVFIPGMHKDQGNTVLGDLKKPQSLSQGSRSQKKAQYKNIVHLSTVLGTIMP